VRRACCGAMRLVRVGLQLWLLTAAPVYAELRLVAELDGLDAQQQVFTRELLRSTEQHLPPTLRARLHDVSVRWASSLPAKVSGKATTDGRLLLNRRLLMQRDQALALRTLVHEVVHLYDRLGPPARLHWYCAGRLQVQGAVGLPAECRGQGERRFRLSDDPRLLDLAGWPERVGMRGQREANNARTLRSPDAYELDSPAEFVAVNAEYFLLDPDYACRRSALHAYFTAHFEGWSPEAAACADSYPYLNAASGPDQPVVGWLDPERIYAVHYLLAEPNEEWASRWGHSMLRLVICAPGRARGPDCMLDLDQHLVLSFRAFVQDVQLSHWDGLVGNYPSRLFMLPLAQVVDEYTKLELRALRSVPLLLSREQIAGVAQQSAMLHWSYDGRYYFVSNNCAVETLKLLRTGTDSPKLLDLDSQTPIGLLQALQARSMADASVLDDPAEALRLGYRFDSYAERYQQIFQPLRAELGLPAEEVEHWLALPPAERRPWFAAADLRASAGLLLLEQAAVRRELLAAQHSLKLRYLDGDAEEAMREAGDLIGQLLLERGFLSRPADLLPEGYGLPQAREWRMLEARSQQRGAALLQLEKRLDAVLPALLSAAQQARLQGGLDNLQLLRERIKALRGEQ